MTAQHPYIVDVFFFVGFSLLLIKFWTWEDAKHDTTRKTVLLLAVVSVAMIGLFAGACWLNYFLNRSNKQSSPTQILQPDKAKGVVSKEQTSVIEGHQSPQSPNISTKQKPSTKIRTSPTPKTTDSASPLPSPPSQAQQPTHGAQTCTLGTACAAEPGSQANVTNSGLPPLKIKFVTGNERSFDKRYEYAQYVTVTVNTEFHPVSLGFICTGEVNDIYAGGAFFNERRGTDGESPNTAYLYYSNPSLAPGVELNVVVYAHKPFKVVSVVKANIR